MGLKTYIINLKSSTHRHEYMDTLLRRYQFLNIEYTEAIDGRKLDEYSINEKFDYSKSRKKYGRTLNKGEVGCALSHRKCYEFLTHSSNRFALILEDDITIVRDLSVIRKLETRIESIMDSPKPRILFLSGDYWFWTEHEHIASVFSAVGAYAYIINKAAANTILREKAFTVADDWDYVKTLNVRYYAIKPYIIDANLNMELLFTDVKQDQWGINKTGMSLKNLMRHFFIQFVKQVLYKCHHFESKIRVIDNKVVNEK